MYFCFFVCRTWLRVTCINGSMLILSPVYFCCVLRFVVFPLSYFVLLIPSRIISLRKRSRGYTSRASSGFLSVPKVSKCFVAQV